MLIAPSILNADNLNLKKGISEARNSGISRFHIDIMDGHFVPNLSFGPELVKDFKDQFDNSYLEVHLMSDKPDLFVPTFINAGADLIEIHYEAMSESKIKYWLKYIHNNGVKAGIVLNPETPAEVIKKFSSQVDQVLVMTVHPGFGGQKFIDQSNKIKEIKQILKKLGSANTPIEVDGGIDKSTILIAQSAGASIFVVGSYIFGSSDISKTINELNEDIQRTKGL